MSKIKKLIYNSGLNIIASILPVLVLQVVVYPLISRTISVNDYGIFLTIIGLAMLMIQVSGTGINNTRIIMNEEYEEQNIKGDFNFIAVICLILNIFIYLFIINVLHIELSIVNLIGTFLYIQLGFINIYLSAEFSILLDFKNVLKSNIFLVLGYFIGLLFFFINHQWSVIFLIGMFCSVAYQLVKTLYWKIGFKRTNLFNKSIKKVLIISFSSLILSLITYADRVFLYPILGATNVAIYYTSAQFGKLIGMGLTPISSVLLSYFSKNKNMDSKKFSQYICINFLFSLIFYIISLFLAEPIINILYPKMTSEILNYINIANLASIMTASSSLIQPIILKFSPTSWQIYIQVVNIVVYFGLALLFVGKWGLLGFCYSNVISAFIRIIILICIGYYTFNVNE